MYLVRKPASVSHEVAAYGLAYGLTALAGLHYSLKLLPDESLLVIGAEKGWFAIQVAAKLGIHVIAVCEQSETVDASPVSDVAYVLAEDVAKTVLEATGELGVDCVLDFTPHHDHSIKTKILQCLGMRGRWCVFDKDFQLDPPEAEQLFLRSASLTFLCLETWLLSGKEQGKILHMVSEILEKLETGAVTARVEKIMPIREMKEAVE
jgi:NADPH:quinone reductase-like Zn-dependent oxidoreductase